MRKNGCYNHAQYSAAFGVKVRRPCEHRNKNIYTESRGLGEQEE
jgi:hypothetical protein